jgi:hypothetical protein
VSPLRSDSTFIDDAKIGHSHSDSKARRTGRSSPVDLLLCNQLRADFRLAAPARDVNNPVLTPIVTGSMRGIPRLSETVSIYPENVSKCQHFLPLPKQRVNNRVGAGPDYSRNDLS